jgi:hypothetical protein
LTEAEGVLLTCKIILTEAEGGGFDQYYFTGQ